MYGHQIKKADACNNKLDDGISGLVWNGNLAKIIVIVKLFLTTLFFFSTIHRYPHRNSTAAAAADTVVVAMAMAVAVAEEEKHTWLILVF